MSDSTDISGLIRDAKELGQSDRKMRAWGLLALKLRKRASELAVTFKIKPADVDDVCQRIATNLPDRLNRFQPGSCRRITFWRWLTVVIKNEFINELRRRARGPVRATTTMVRGIECPVTRTAAKDKLQQIEEFLKLRGKPRALEVFRLYREGLNTKEIASRLGVCTGSVNRIFGETTDLIRVAFGSKAHGPFGDSVLGPEQSS